MSLCLGGLLSNKSSLSATEAALRLAIHLPTTWRNEPDSLLCSALPGTREPLFALEPLHLRGLEGATSASSEAMLFRETAEIPVLV